MSMTDQFTDPGSTDKLTLPDLLGSLLLFTVDSVEHAIPTTFGESDAVRCTVVALDGDLAGTEWPDTLVFPRVLQGQLRGQAGGGRVLGRLSQGVAKPGQSPPWKLEPASDADKDVARTYLAQAPAPAPVDDGDPF